MNIIFVHNNMAKARTLNWWQTLSLFAVLVTVPPLLMLSLILPQGNAMLKAVNPAALLPAKFHLSQDERQEHINALAIQLGQIQARVTRLNALGERLAKLAGVKEQDFDLDAVPGQGGPIARPHNLSEQDIEQQMTVLIAELERKSDRYGALESVLLQQSLKKDTLPSSRPVSAAYNSSSFGWRVDPFTGQMAFHEGLDFMANAGTPIHAAASGIVAAAEKTPDYGNIVKIDHGAGVETRYAHISRILVKPGQRVEKGQLIAEIGNTGRSTGAHLHFEVRLNGVALDPRRYLGSNQG
ncbi:MAG: peptidase M23 [Methylophilales bacterium RIFCSPHIGHO2_02_FULL_57_10]|nr:MAG: peptidase M23 [Methylophilales bacterium RIFCSPHIGHO2_02_FULL_57_10]